MIERDMHPLLVERPGDLHGIIKSLSRDEAPRDPACRSIGDDEATQTLVLRQIQQCISEHRCFTPFHKKYRSRGTRERCPYSMITQNRGGHDADPIRPHRPRRINSLRASKPKSSGSMSRPCRMTKPRSISICSALLAASRSKG